MRYLLKNTAAVLSVVCGNFNIIPTCKMKFTPFRLNVRSSSGAMPSTIDGACSNSSSTNIHCSSASTTAGGGGRGRSRLGGSGVTDADTITGSPAEYVCGLRRAERERADRAVEAVVHSKSCQMWPFKVLDSCDRLESCDGPCEVDSCVMVEE